tara:strand:- start:489 stop:713 length:225 start_codon:yes stop_codon:yes gene_type:complete
LRGESKVPPKVWIAYSETNHIGEDAVGKLYLALMVGFVRIRGVSVGPFVLKLIFIFIVWVIRQSGANDFRGGQI